MFTDIVRSHGQVISVVVQSLLGGERQRTEQAVEEEITLLLFKRETGLLFFCHVVCILPVHDMISITVIHTIKYDLPGHKSFQISSRQVAKRTVIPLVSKQSRHQLQRLVLLVFIQYVIPFV